MKTQKSQQDICLRCGKLRKQVGVLIPYKGAYVCDSCVQERNREALQELGGDADDPEAVARPGLADDQSPDDDFEFEDEMDDFHFSGHRLSLDKLEKILKKNDVRRIEDLSKEIDPQAVSLIPKAVAEQFCLIPLYMEGADLVVAFSDPNDEEAIEEVQYFSGLKVSVVAADAIEIEEAIERYYEP